MNEKAQCSSIPRRANLRLARWLLAATVIALTTSACAERADEQRRRKPQATIPSVEAVVARQGGLPLQERVSGTVRARNQVAVRSEIPAPIVAVLARNGDTVAKGQPLVRLDDTELRAQLRQAEAAVELATASAQETRARLTEVASQLERARAMARERLISAMDLEALEAQHAAARAAVAQADARVQQAQATAAERRNALTRTVIRAPAAGRVGQRRAEVGMIAGGSEVLFVLGDPSDLVLEVPLTQEMLAHMSVGNRVRVHVPGTDAPIAGTLARISPFLASESFSTLGEIEVETSGRLTPGMFVTADILYGESEQATLIPLSAIWQEPETGNATVFVVQSIRGADATSSLDGDPKPIEQRVISVQAEGGGMAGVENVEPGEWVVVAGQHLLAEDDSRTARVRTAAWERILELQSLQREDILVDYLQRQQQYASTRGSVPPSNEEYLRGSSTPQQGKVK